MCVRGYYSDKLVIYTNGDDFDAVPHSEVPKYVNLVLQALNITDNVVDIHNGLIKGKIGDIWPPIVTSILVRGMKHETTVEQDDSDPKKQIKSIW